MATGAAAGAGLPSAEDLAAAHRFAAGLFAPEAAKIAPLAPEALVVCGGTVTTLVAVDLALEPYDSSRVHLARLTAAKVAELEASLAAKTVDELTVSESDLLFGLSLTAATALPGEEGTNSPVGWKPTMRPLPRYSG